MFSDRGQDSLGVTRLHLFATDREDQLRLTFEFVVELKWSIHSGSAEGHGDGQQQVDALAFDLDLVDLDQLAL